MAKYFEDLNIGDRLVCASRTVTETDLVLFSSLTHLYDEIHLNEEHMKRTRFGRRLIPGPYTMGLTLGLIGLAGDYFNRVIALLEIESLKVPAPVFCGDTVTAASEVVEKRETSKPERGVVKFRESAVNQRGELVLEMYRVVLYQRRPCGEATAFSPTASVVGGTHVR